MKAEGTCPTCGLTFALDTDQFRVLGVDAEAMMACQHGAIVINKDGARFEPRRPELRLVS